MKELIEKVRNIFRIPELKNRIVYTLGLLMVFRLGSHVILPGVNSEALTSQMSSGSGGITDLLNIFVGGAFQRGAIFALGIMPYISASIIVQLLAIAVPAVAKKQKEGESGQKWINQLTRYLTVLITLGQAPSYLAYISNTTQGVFISSTFFYITSVLILSAGTLFLVWLGERITDNGIGNGVSLIIAIGIISQLPVAIWQEVQTQVVLRFYMEVIALGIVTMAVVALTQATRKIPINYARRMIGNRMMSSNARQYIPLKINSAGVMPIIFAQSLMFIPAQLMMMLPETNSLRLASNFLTNNTGVVYNVIFSALIILFSYFYTAIVINPTDIADNLKRNGGFIPGIKPGKKTADYIDNILAKITLPGSIFLAFVAILPAIAQNLGLSRGFADFFGGTSILIMIGVVLDTLQQIESYLLMRHYDGLMKSGKMRKSQAPGVAV